MAPTYGTSNTTVAPSGTGAPFAGSTGTIDNAAGKLSTSALGLLVVGGVVLVSSLGPVHSALCLTVHQAL